MNHGRSRTGLLNSPGTSTARTATVLEKETPTRRTPPRGPVGHDVRGTAVAFVAFWGRPAARTARQPRASTSTG